MSSEYENEVDVIEAGDTTPPAVTTPLPKLQLSIIFFIQICEPITGSVILPFINQLIFEFGLTGGSESAVGYYAGAIMSIFYVTETLSVLFWGSLSDRIGRRPVVLIGIFGVTISIFLFGLSKTFFGLLFSRGLSGALNGNIGVLKSMVTEITTEDNQAKAWSFAPIVFAAGATFAPLIGGSFSHPYERFPGIFGHSTFWQTYPYFLPCFIAGAFPLVAFIISAIFMKETLHHTFRQSANSHETAPLFSEARPTPPSIRSTLTPRVQVAVLNYGTISLLSMMLVFIQPLFLSTPIGDGGMGLSTPTIGLLLGLGGLYNGLSQALLFPRLHRWLGTKRLFMASVASYIPLYAAWPWMDVLATRSGQFDGRVKTVFILQQFFLPLGRMGFSCSHIFLTSAAPSKSSLGTTTGLGQTVASFTRAVGPLLAASLFATSIKNNILGGHLVYVVLVFFVVGSLYGAKLLPTVMKRASEENDD